MVRRECPPYRRNCDLNLLWILRRAHFLIITLSPRLQTRFSLITRESSELFSSPALETPPRTQKSSSRPHCIFPLARFLPPFDSRPSSPQTLMSRSTRLYTLCVLFLLAYHPPTTAAQFELQRRVSINQLERRQGFGDLFGGGGRDSTTTPSVAASSPTTAATAATSAANTAAANDSPSVSSTSTQTSTTTSQNGFGLPIFGGGRSSSSASSAEVDPTASAVAPFSFRHAMRGQRRLPNRERVFYQLG